MSVHQTLLNLAIDNTTTKNIDFDTIFENFDNFLINVTMNITTEKYKTSKNENKKKNNADKKVKQKQHDELTT